MIDRDGGSASSQSQTIDREPSDDPETGSANAQEEPPNYYDLSDDERGQLLIDYLLLLVNEERNTGSLFEIYSFKKDGKIMAPGSSSGMFGFIANVTAGGFRGYIQVRFSGTTDYIESEKHHIFSAYGPSLKPVEIRSRDSNGRLTSEKHYQYSATFGSLTNNIVFVVTILGNIEQTQAFANSVINPMRRTIPPH